MSGEAMDAGLDLLDRQIVDADGQMIGKVDDLELALEGRDLVVSALLMGGAALGGRLGGRLGRWVARASSRLSGTSEPVRIAIDVVKDIGVQITLSVTADDVPRAGDAERWFRDHFVGRLPGSGDASE